jgi:hypothetical protein
MTAMVARFEAPWIAAVESQRWLASTAMQSVSYRSHRAMGHHQFPIHRHSITSVHLLALHGHPLSSLRANLPVLLSILRVSEVFLATRLLFV